MAELSRVQKYMIERRRVVLRDGRTGRIVRIDTHFPTGSTTVSLWTAEGPGLAKVELEAVVGPAVSSSAPRRA